MEEVSWEEFFLDACRYGELEELKQEVLSNPRPLHRIRDEYGNSPLHMAAANNQTEVIKFVLSIIPEELLKDFLDARNTEGGNTALHWAALNGHRESVEILVEAGADAMITNAAGRTALEEAESRNHESCAKYLAAEMSKIMKQTQQDGEDLEMEVE